MEFANVLSTWSYKDESNNLHRRRMIKARERSRRLRKFIFEQYELVDNAGNAVNYEEAFWWPYLIQWTHALRSYKQNAQKARIEHRELGNKGAKLKDVNIVLAAVVQRPAGLKRLYAESPSGAKSFAWAGPKFEVRAKAEVESEYRFLPVPFRCELMSANPQRMKMAM
jgi:hypothetical protein